MERVLALHTSSTFLQEFLHIFKEPILRCILTLRRNMASLKQLELGFEGWTHLKRQILLDALISINTRCY